LVLNKFLGEPTLNSTITSDGNPPKATWKANPVISKWGFMSRKMDDGYVKIKYSIFMKEIMLLGHSNVLGMGSNMDMMICMLSLGKAKGDGQPDYINVRLLWTKWSNKVCGKKTRENGMMFDKEEFPINKEEMLERWV
jgi:hypothetical protein